MSKTRRAPRATVPPPATPPRDPRPWLIALGVLSIGIGGAMQYARGAAMVALYHFLADGAIALAWISSAAGIGAFVMRFSSRVRLLPHTSSPGTPGEGRGGGF